MPFLYKLLINKYFVHPHSIGMEDAKYLPNAAKPAAAEHPDVISVLHPDDYRNASRLLVLSNRLEVGMTKLVMMWLFGVPVSVLLLFMIFGAL